MADRTMRLTRYGCRVVLGAAVAAVVGCLGSEKKADPLTRLNPDLQSKLGNLPKPQTKAATPPAFDPTATGGTGVTVQNSFGRTKPADGAKAQYAVTLPPPQPGVQPGVAAPTMPGVAQAPAATPTRSSMPDRTASALPTPAPITPLPAKIDPPASEPPITRANYESAKPIPPAPVMLSTPMRDPEPGPVPPPPPAALPIPTQSGPVNLPTPAAGGPLPPIPSATDAPIRGVQPPVRIPPADPLRPQ